LDRIRQTGTRLVMVSSKTHVEIEAVRAEMGNTDPFVSENGGAVFIPSGYDLDITSGIETMNGYKVIRLGARFDDISKGFDRLAAWFPVKAFSRMSADEVMALTGLKLSQVKLAQAREFSEPFIVTDNRFSEEDLAEAVDKLGFTLTHGGRFYHLTGPNDKGRAVGILSGLFKRRRAEVVTVGFGDAKNDEPLLRAVDRPFLVARPDGSHCTMDVPGLVKTPAVGPEWAILTGCSSALSKRDNPPTDCMI